MLSKKILQFAEPKRGEPICSGMELSTSQGQQLNLAHFHTVVSVKTSKPRNWFGGNCKGVALDCKVMINGRQYENQTFEVHGSDIGKTLFCAGFPCLTVTGFDEENEGVIITLSEIVDQCDPNCPPWG
ncbi:MAG: hypothetical protein K2X77_30720 [Candidatus Obscuribacterales bacterium]|jgi:hypothetical protein|nr:hypothetical protein [Candidatus Obscuribacterales bacterium]